MFSARAFSGTSTPIDTSEGQLKSQNGCQPAVRAESPQKQKFDPLTKLAASAASLMIKLASHDHE